MIPKSKIARKRKKSSSRPIFRTSCQAISRIMHTETAKQREQTLVAYQKDRERLSAMFNDFPLKCNEDPPD